MAKKYILRNEWTRKDLELPRLGVWNTEDHGEAVLMLEAARQYMDSLGLQEQRDRLQIVAIEPEGKCEAS